MPYFRLVEGRRVDSGSSLGPPFVFFVKMSRPIHRQSERGKGGAFAPGSAGLTQRPAAPPFAAFGLPVGLAFSYFFLSLRRVGKDAGG
ncbi:protein of unknown function (plasmid) [Methylocella tundrae]|uniref:Uncharacterized protein n=1 Tax=Methylocella tundrae TaxID=227605 RepID=A0A4U8Z8L1_METTU|nr:protein of unknown function [Methylocella tundrae]